MNWREDKTMIVLSAGLMFFTAVTLGVVWLRSEDIEIYSLFAQAFSAFLGALMMHLKGDKVPPAGSTTVVDSKQITQVPPDPPPVADLAPQGGKTEAPAPTKLPGQE